MYYIGIGAFLLYNIAPFIDRNTILLQKYKKFKNNNKGGLYMYCSNCGKEGSGKYCAECGGLLIEGEQEKKQYIQPPRKPLETDISEYINNHSINITEIMEHYEKNKEYGIEVLAYYSDISLQEAEAYINNRIYKQSQPKRTLFGILKRNFMGNKTPKEQLNGQISQ